MQSNVALLSMLFRLCFAQLLIGYEVDDVSSDSLADAAPPGRSLRLRYTLKHLEGNGQEALTINHLLVQPSVEIINLEVGTLNSTAKTARSSLDLRVDIQESRVLVNVFVVLVNEPRCHDGVQLVGLRPPSHACSLGGFGALLLLRWFHLGTWACVVGGVLKSEYGPVEG